MAALVGAGIDDYVGQLGFYVAVVDDTRAIDKTTHSPTVGVLAVIPRDVAAASARRTTALSSR
jgi:hypothetical protein